MALVQSLHTGLTGLQNHQKRMDNLGNNFANVNTTGFKQGVHAFSSLFSQMVHGTEPATEERGAINPKHVGVGVTTSTILKDFTQGPFETTGRELDLAVDGAGFFVLRNPDAESGDPGDQFYYTRDGAFYLDAAGASTDDTLPKRLTGNNGLPVQGLTATDGVLPPAGTAFGDIYIPFGQIRPGQVSSALTLNGNLNPADGTNSYHQIATGAGTTWESLNGRSINVGHVETSAALWDAAAGSAATAATDLADLEYLAANGERYRAFAGIANVNTPKAIDLRFTKGETTRNETFTYGTDGTTLTQFANWLCGGVNDDGVDGASERLTGGVTGTVQTAAQTLSADGSTGYEAVQEQAGAYFRTFTAAQGGAVDYGAGSGAGLDPTTRLSIASNIGDVHAISGLRLEYNGDIMTDIFEADTGYSDGDLGGADYYSSVEVFADEGGTIEPHLQTMRLSLVDQTDVPSGADTEGYSTWRWTLDPEEGDGGGAAQTGLLLFDGDGSLVRSTQSAGTLTFSFPDITQRNTDNLLTIADQDGYAENQLEDFYVDREGAITGLYSNGEQILLAQVGLGRVPNPEGLSRVAENLFITGPASGDAFYGTPLSEGFGEVRAGTLENSNVILANAMSDLVFTQRGYQFSSRVVSTSDELLQILLRLGR